MRFVVDAQLPPLLADWLVARGHVADHVLKIGLTAADDGEIWALAAQFQAHVLTKDEDFVVIRQQQTDGPAVVWLRIGNATNDALIAWMHIRWPAIESALASGEVIVEVR